MLSKEDLQFNIDNIFIFFSYTSNRPPQYHSSSLPPPPPPPHHSMQSWQQHTGHSFPSPLGQSGGVHHDYYSSPNPSFPPPMPTITPHERNNNEPSMTSPNRYTTSFDTRLDNVPPGKTFNIILYKE